MELLPNQACPQCQHSFVRRPSTTTLHPVVNSVREVLAHKQARSRPRSLILTTKIESNSLNCGRQKQKFRNCLTESDIHSRFCQIEWAQTYCYRPLLKSKCQISSWSRENKGAELGEFRGTVGRMHLDFRRSKGSRLTIAMANVDSGSRSEDSTVELELGILKFMQQSNRPDVFPSQTDLVAAGRTDLLRGISGAGGWLAAGWEDPAQTGEQSFKGSTNNQAYFPEETLSDDAHQRCRRNRNPDSTDGTSVTGKFSEAPTGPDEVTVESADDADQLVRLNTGGEQVFHTLPPHKLCLQTILADSDRQLTRRPSYDLARSPHTEGGYEQASANGTETETTKSINMSGERIFEVDNLVKALLDASSANNRETVQISKTGVPRRTKNGRMKIEKKILEATLYDGEVNGTMMIQNWIDKTMDERTRWILDAKSQSIECLYHVPREAYPEPLQHRVHSHDDETKLVDKCAKLESGREQTVTAGSPYIEIMEAENDLKFRDNAIRHARSELSNIRAQVAALEETLRLKITETQKAMEENNLRLEKATMALRSLRTALIVWPNSAKEVFLTGSFDGWKSQIKMEHSSAGVYVVSLQLYPGRYEIKFIVDGSWRVDTNRPTVHDGSFQNNVLIIS